MKNKETLSKGIRSSSIALVVIVTAPVLLTMGFKGIRLEDPMFGWVLLTFGVISAITGMVLLSKGIKYLLDYLFEK